MRPRRMLRFAADQQIEDIEMKSHSVFARLRLALIGAVMTCAAAVALADIKDYEFRLVEPTVKAGPDKIITVRLVNKTTGKPVPDAVIFATRLDMAPDGMQEMATKITPVPGAEPGIYRFKATFGMAGRWQLSLGAKVQGETGTVEGKLVITAHEMSRVRPRRRRRRCHRWRRRARGLSGDARATVTATTPSAWSSPRGGADRRARRSIIRTRTASRRIR